MLPEADTRGVPMEKRQEYKSALKRARRLERDLDAALRATRGLRALPRIEDDPLRDPGRALAMLPKR